MSDRSAWWRTGAGVAAWLALAVAASGAAWAAVGVVGDESQPSAIAVPTQGDDGTQPTQPSTPGTTSTTTPSPDNDPRTSETLISTGGRVTVSCTGPETIRLDAALANTGWRSLNEESGPDEVEVEFTNGDTELRTRARCEGGVIEPDVETADD